MWHDMFPKDHPPTFDEIDAYIGEGSALWRSLRKELEENIGARPKMTYSGCSGAPGWNIKYQKSSQALGTFYPDNGFFSAMIIIGYRLDPAMQAILPTLSAHMREMYESAGDYMKIGKWMMFPIDNPDILDDYIKLIYVKLDNLPAKSGKKDK